MTPPSDGFRTRIALVCQPDTRRLRTDASLLALALHSPFPAFPISPLGEQDSPGALPAMPVCVGYSPAVLPDGLRQGKHGESRKSVCSYSSDLKCV